MTTIDFELLSRKHGTAVIDIFNYYIENSFTAYPGEKVPYSYFDKFLEIAENYPAYAILTEGKPIGFCFLNAYNPLTVFKETAVITYFIHRDYTGKGIGKIALGKLEEEARRRGIRILLAHIASANEGSLSFHSKNGFKECGRFVGIMKKKNRRLDIIWVQKRLKD